MLRNAADLPAAASVLARAAGPGSRPDRIRKTAAFHMAAPGGHRLLVKVLSELDARSLPVDEASLRRPTLDDVFLQLTGQRPPPAQAPRPHRRKPEVAA